MIRGIALMLLGALAAAAQMRPPAVPLVAHDPYFSIWSMSDHLNGDVYFKTHRPGHNLDRFRVQAALIDAIDRQFDQMQEVVANYAG